MLGFAVLMFGMSTMSQAIVPLKENPVFISTLTKFSNPLLGILAGVAFTTVLQSASAAVGILQALTATGTMRFDVALPLIMGIAIGAAVPVLLSAVGAAPDGKRTAFAYLVSNLLGAAIAAVGFYGLNGIFDFPFMYKIMNTVDVALLNTIYRFIIVILLLPMSKQIEKITAWVRWKPSEGVQDMPKMKPLEERFVSHPALAVEQSRNAINDMAEKAKDNLLLALDLLYSYSQEQYDRVFLMEDFVDRYEDRIGTYLLKVNAYELDSAQSGDVSKFLHTITDFERISDHAVNLAYTAKESYEKETHFSQQALQELTVLEDAVREIISVTIHAFLDNDLRMAVKVEPLDELIDNLCGEAKLHHVDRLHAGICKINAGFQFNDRISNYERIADHCSNIAVAMIAIESETFDTHEYLNSVRKLKSESYSTYFEEYSRKYSLSGEISKTVR